jgi:hypothetical protein
MKTKKIGILLLDLTITRKKIFNKKKTKGKEKKLLLEFQKYKKLEKQGEKNPIFVFYFFSFHFFIF